MRSFRGCHNFWIFVAIEEGITTVSFWAWANRVVIYNFTFSISSTGSWTGIKASLLDTSLCKLTFRAKKALRPAIRRNAKETREPSANRSSTLGSVFTAWSKWIWITKILWFNCYRLIRNDDTLCEWVPSESSGTSTGSNMVNCLTSSIDATCTGPWIYTFKIRTCSISWTIRVKNTFCWRSTLCTKQKLTTCRL